MAKRLKAGRGGARKGAGRKRGVSNPSKLAHTSSVAKASPENCIESECNICTALKAGHLSLPEPKPLSFGLDSQGQAALLLNALAEVIVQCPLADSVSLVDLAQPMPDSKAPEAEQMRVLKLLDDFGEFGEPGKPSPTVYTDANGNSRLMTELEWNDWWERNRAANGMLMESDGMESTDFEAIELS